MPDSQASPPQVIDPSSAAGGDSATTSKQQADSDAAIRNAAMSREHT